MGTSDADFKVFCAGAAKVVRSALADKFHAAAGYTIFFTFGFGLF